MANSHASTTLPKPFHFPVRKRVVRLVRPPATRPQAIAVAKELMNLAHELLSPLSIDEEILIVMGNYGRQFSTTQLTAILKRRKTRVIEAVHRLAAAGKIERRGTWRRWVRVKEEK